MILVHHLHGRISQHHQGSARIDGVPLDERDVAAAYQAQRILAVTIERPVELVTNNQALAQTKIAKRQAERARRGARRPARQEGAAGREEARSAIDGQGVVVAVLFVACCVCACQISLPTRFLKRHASRTLTSSQCTGAREPID